MIVVSAGLLALIGVSVLLVRLVTPKATQADSSPGVEVNARPRTVSTAGAGGKRGGARDCDHWTRTLGPGARGADVATLQTRVAGWAAIHGDVPVDGVYDAPTKAAVARFQAGYGLPATGVADNRTYAQIARIENRDCTPAHFSMAQFTTDQNCGHDLNAGKVPRRKIEANLGRLMWKMEALQHKLHGAPLKITSGFRTVRCNLQVGTATNSQHIYGTAADVISPSPKLSLCEIARAARDAGFSGIIGPGAPGHSNHVHLDSRAENKDDGMPDTFYWSAPDCGIPTSHGTASGD
jgi:zinc D-Ala-D-Ala carboxypeptidase